MKVIDISEYEKINSDNNKIESDHSITELTQLTQLKSLESNIDLGIDQDNPDLQLFDFPTEKDTPVTSGSFYNSKKNYSFQNQKSKNIFKSTRKGNMFMCLYTSLGEPLIVIGPHWPFALFMMTFIDTSIFFYFYFLWSSLNIIIRYIGVLVCSTQVISYFFVFITNPGIPTKDLWIENYFKEKHEEDDMGSYRICNVCKIIMKNKDDTDHCHDCDICIVGVDHHCPWTSKCIGKKNIKLFYVFTGSTFALIIYFFVGFISLCFN